MTEFEFNLADRIQKIQSINKLYDLENNSYISFSGGKDSSVLSALIDLALPDNKIPRLYINTGIEYKMMINHVEREREIQELSLFNQHKISKKCLILLVILLSQKNIQCIYLFIKIVDTQKQSHVI